MTEVWVVLIVALLGLILAGVWIGVALGLTGVILLVAFGGSASLALMVSATWNMLTKFTISAVALFIILGGCIMTFGFARTTYDSLGPLLQRLPGGLLHSNVVSNALMGAVSGSAAACASALGRIAYPELVSRGYDRVTTAASLAGSSTLGIIIPPSIPLILIGSMQGVSVAAMFAAVLVPGLIATALFMVLTFTIAIRNPTLVPQTPKEDRVPLWVACKKLLGIWQISIVMLVVLGTIYLGLATPTEAAGLAVVVTLILAVCMRTFTWRAFLQSLYDSAQTFGIITLLFIGAVVLSIAVSMLGLPKALIGIVASSGLPIWATLAILYVVYLVLGMFFDNISFLLMTLPFVYPLVLSLGYDPLWFGVMIVMVSMIGMVTPPVGLNLYIIVGISKGEVPLEDLARACVPYWLVVTALLAFICVVPEVCLWLPRLLFGS